jgi:peptide-methionine (S)-S-oxide reductase
VFQLDFDPQQLSYEELVRLVCANRRGGRAYSRQYMEVVFCADEAQEAAAKRAGIAVPIVRGGPFYLAEDYHQKYYLRHDRLLSDELAAYSPRELVDSTVAARLNGYVAGRGTPEQLREDLPRFGLSAAATAHLERIVADRRGHL